MYKPLPIGVDNFEKIIQENYYYIDKTLFIKELLNQKGEVNLFTRPRRFGKTLNLSMLRYFFEDTGNEETNVERRKLFEGLKIMNAGEKYTKRQTSVPVIFLTLKSAKQPNFEMAYASLVDEIIKEYKRHAYMLEGNALNCLECEKYQKIISGKAAAIDYTKSLEFLSYCLKQYHKKNSIILIDEYDVPLENSYFEGFYAKMITFIRSFFESALKSNEHLDFAVITGCLRISKESIFTGLNHLDIISVLNQSYAEHFGFIEPEVDCMLNDFGLSSHKEKVKQWYNGYLFGKTEVYNPWSLIKYTKDMYHENTSFPKPYWSNTSSNNIVKDLVVRADLETKQEIEDLIDGGTIEKEIHEEITYEDIYDTKDNLWNFLFFTGYLKKCGERQNGKAIYLQMKIPNLEVKYVYRNTILDWFNKNIQNQDMTKLITALETGDCDSAGEFITEQLMNTISFYDYKEEYYHGFLAGLLKVSQKYLVKSNRESGLGRFDLTLKTLTVRGQAIILELNVADSFQEMERCCCEALQQIETRKYEQDLVKEGYSHITKYEISFYKKECLVKGGE